MTLDAPFLSHIATFLLYVFFVATWVALRNLAYILRFVILLNVQHRFPVD